MYLYHDLFQLMHHFIYTQLTLYNVFVKFGKTLQAINKLIKHIGYVIKIVLRL